MAAVTVDILERRLETHPFFRQLGDFFYFLLHFCLVLYFRLEYVTYVQLQ